MNVEVGKEGEHEEHVAGQQILSPDGKVTLYVDAVESMCQRDEELNLNDNTQHTAVEQITEMFQVH